MLRVYRPAMVKVLKQEKDTLSRSNMKILRGIAEVLKLSGHGMVVEAMMLTVCTNKMNKATPADAACRVDAFAVTFGLVT